MDSNGLWWTLMVLNPAHARGSNPETWDLNSYSLTTDLRPPYKYKFKIVSNLQITITIVLLACGSAKREHWNIAKVVNKLVCCCSEAIAVVKLSGKWVLLSWPNTATDRQGLPV